MKADKKKTGKEMILPRPLEMTYFIVNFFGRVNV